jgi:hypothetical protein
MIIRSSLSHPTTTTTLGTARVSLIVSAPGSQVKLLLNNLTDACKMKNERLNLGGTHQPNRQVQNLLRNEVSPEHCRLGMFLSYHRRLSQACG